MTKKVSTTVAQETERKEKQRTDRGDPKTAGVKVALGTIKEQITGTYKGKKYFQVRVLIDKEYSLYYQADPIEWYGLGHPMDVIVHIYGDNLIGRRVKIDYRGIYPHQGVVTITGAKGNEGDMELATEIAPLGTILAPAGSMF